MKVFAIKICYHFYTKDIKQFLLVFVKLHFLRQFFKTFSCRPHIKKMSILTKIEKQIERGIKLIVDKTSDKFRLMFATKLERELIKELINISKDLRIIEEKNNKNKKS